MKQGRLRAGSLIKWVRFNDGSCINICRTLGKGSDKRPFCVMTSKGVRRYFGNYENALLAFTIWIKNTAGNGIAEQGEIADIVP